MTAQEISQFGRRGLRSIVFVLNNSWLSQRAHAMQGHGFGLQRHSRVELCRASPCLGLA